MLENIADRFASVVKTLRGQTRITDSNSAEMLRDIRVTLLEADVALPVIKIFLEKIKSAALGTEVLESLTPGQMLVGIVHQELVSVMGGAEQSRANLNLATNPPAVVLMTGLQGVGKTTTSGKLARYLKSNKKKVLLVSVDVYRPAAILQLTKLGEQIEVDVFKSDLANPLEISSQALEYAKAHLYDVLIVDTAGRLAIDTDMMLEIRALSDLLQPIETLFVLDAMMGQDALVTAKVFHESIKLTGIVATKLDSDTRGGAVLSAYHTVGCPIKFIGVSEKQDGLEVFDSDKMARRILGMGDVLSLFEDAKNSFHEVEAQELASKLKLGKGYDLTDFRMQLSQMDKMGGVEGLIAKLPLAMQRAVQQMPGNFAQKNASRMRGIIDAMTLLERRKPDLIKASRKRRIAKGAGVPVHEVNKLLNQYDSMAGMMKKLKGGNKLNQMKALLGKF